jgi:hypothetical protein
MDKSSMVLYHIGNHATAQLINVLSDPNERVRYYAKKALFFIGAKVELAEIAKRDGNPIRTAEAYDTLLWIEKGQFVASWAQVNATPATSAPQQVAEEKAVDLEPNGQVRVFVEEKDKIVPVTMSVSTFRRKLSALPEKERNAVLKAREAYTKAMRGE